jgi:hypothetical protein
MSEVGKPRAKSDMKCPLWRKPMKQVCHTCEWWVHLRGKPPQGDEVIDQWGCAIAWLPCLMVENSQQQRNTAASVDKVATELNQASNEATALRAELVGSIVRAVSDQERHLRITNETYHHRSR